MWYFADPLPVCYHFAHTNHGVLLQDFEALMSGEGNTALNQATQKTVNQPVAFIKHEVGPNKVKTHRADRTYPHIELSLAIHQHCPGNGNFLPSNICRCVSFENQYRITLMKYDAIKYYSQ